MDEELERRKIKYQEEHPEITFFENKEGILPEGPISAMRYNREKRVIEIVEEYIPIEWSETLGDLISLMDEEKHELGNDYLLMIQAIREQNKSWMEKIFFRIDQEKRIGTAVLEKVRTILIENRFEVAPF
jgi:hypothetical protein